MTSARSASLRVGVLLCDDLHAGLVSRWPSYLALFRDLLADERGDLQARGWRVHAGEWPDGPEAADAVVDRALATLPPEDDTPAFRRLLRDWLRGEAAAGLQPTG